MADPSSSCTNRLTGRGASVLVMAVASLVSATGSPGCSSGSATSGPAPDVRLEEPQDAAPGDRDDSAPRQEHVADASVDSPKDDGLGAEAASNAMSTDASRSDAGIAHVEQDGAEAGPDGTGHTDGAFHDPVQGSVAGLLVEFGSRRRLANRTVWIGQNSTVTDAHGSFALPAPNRYDVTVIDPDRTSVSVYKGLFRRDIVLGHRPSRAGDATQKQSLVSGNLVGGEPFPLGLNSLFTVYLFSSSGRARQFLGASPDLEANGPAFGPLRVAWNGADGLPAQLVAFGFFRGGNETSRTYWMASQQTSARSGTTEPIELALSPTTSTAVACRAELPTGAVLRQAQAYYRLPTVSGVIQLDEQLDPAKTFEFRFPDLSSIGATPCVAAVADPGPLWTEICDSGLGTRTLSANLSVKPAPALTRQTGDGGPGAFQTLSWTGTEKGVYVLRLGSESGAASAPQIDVYTTATGEAWPDLALAGIPFPSATLYEATVGVLGPYGTMDEALGPDGMNSWVPKETRQSDSRRISFSTP